MKIRQDVWKQKPWSSEMKLISVPRWRGKKITNIFPFSYFHFSLSNITYIFPGAVLSLLAWNKTTVHLTGSLNRRLKVCVQLKLFLAWLAQLDFVPREQYPETFYLYNSKSGIHNFAAFRFLLLHCGCFNMLTGLSVSKEFVSHLKVFIYGLANRGE